MNALSIFSTLPIGWIVAAILVIAALIHFGPQIKARLTRSSATASSATPSSPSLFEELKAHVDAAAVRTEASAKSHATDLYRALKAEIAKIATPKAADVLPAPAPVPAPSDAAASVAAAVTLPASAPPGAMPQLVTIDGVQYRLDAPLNAAYRPSMTARIFGKPPHFVGDPSNGKQGGLPTRSAAGYPLYYATAGGHVVGTPTVLQGDQSFNSDEEVAAYNAKTTANPAQQAQAAADWARLDAAYQAHVAAAPPPERTSLAATYASAAALAADLAALHFTGGVTLDGVVINSGSGKADGSPWAYTTQPDGSVKAA